MGRKGYDPHEIGRNINSNGKNSSRNLQYGKLVIKHPPLVKEKRELNVFF